MKNCVLLKKRDAFQNERCYNENKEVYMINRIILNETSYFGRNARSILAEEIPARHFKKALVVTDQTLLDAKVATKVMEILDNNEFAYEVFSDVKPNPTVENVLTGLAQCKEANADYIIAVGGGSAIDTAKCIGIIMTNPEFSDVVSLDGVANTKNKALPIIALPTTAGTAAEVTINYVITDTKQVKKMVCVDPHDIPVLAIIDPELMDSMPASIASSTGMDALTHAMEGFITKGAWTMTDMFHLQAIAMIYDNLEAAVNQKDATAMDQVGYAQYIAGMGFSNVGLGIVHSMAHSLGAYYDTPHGLANALLLPFVLKFNGAVCPDRFRQMAMAFHINVTGMTDTEVVDSVVAAVRKLAIAVHIPQTLSEIGVKEEDLTKLAHQAINDVCTGGNPREVTEEQILNLYREAF